MTKKKILYAVLCVMLLGSVDMAFAARVKDIQRGAKKKTMFGEKYQIYRVRCSDGSKRTISAWNKRKKWCLGKSKKKCSNDQLKTAKSACKKG
ncbi:MAG: hypothetical protein GY862_28930 [Gammaproteobacteria bacterium]|nr:hypothetical protein [Gammaproteobacteria bacterium]